MTRIDENVQLTEARVQYASTNEGRRTYRLEVAVADAWFASVKILESRRSIFNLVRKVKDKVQDRSLLI